MFTSPITFMFSTFVLVTRISTVSAFWRLLCDNPVTIGRYDPLVSPGAIAGHVHTVSGGSGFGMSTTYQQMREASCTSCQIQQDLSNYWIPQLYYQNANNGSFEDVNTIGGMTVYYLQRGSNVTAFPPGFKMLAGNPYLRSYNNILEQQAINFVCLDYSAGSSSSTGLPTKNCPQGLRAQVVFPSCWNGKDLDTADHKSHMAYPDQISDGNCPANFPVRLVTIFYEVTFTVDDFSQRWHSDRDQPFVFAQGDPTGYGLHGDFINGWDQSFLQEAVDTCTNGSGLEQDCPLFDLAYGQQCHITPQVNEVVSGSLKTLPGCNPVQFGPGNATPKTCVNSTIPEVWNTTTQYEGTTAPPTSHFLADQPQTKTNYSTFSFIGCYSDSASRTLPYNVGVAGNFTVESCLDSCNNNNYPYGGLENGQECWCGNTAPADAGASLLGFASCGTACSGNSLELCGGGWALSVYNNTAIVPPSIPQKSTDLSSSYSGCYVDNANRILPMSMGSTNGTVDGCVSSCKKAGYPYSGIEYMGQCYCSASMPSSTLKTADGDCNMRCSGDKTKYCGAGYRLQMYNAAVSSSSSSLASSSSSSSSAITLSTPSVQALPYAGCYTDSASQRLLSHQLSSNKTIEGCLQSCTSSGYKIAGLEYGGECWCDNVVTSSITKAPESDCNMPCSGNLLEICGSGNRLSIYNATALSPPSIQQSVGGLSYAGCWTDDGNRVMQSASPKNQTVAGCVSQCQSLGFSQAGIEYGGECYCGALAARSTKAADSDCSMVCRDDATHLCGSGYRLQVYNSTTAATASSSSSSSAVLTSAKPATASSSSVAILISSTTASSTSTSSMTPLVSSATTAAISVASSISSRTTASPVAGAAVAAAKAPTSSSTLSSSTVKTSVVSSTISTSTKTSSIPIAPNSSTMKPITTSFTTSKSTSASTSSMKSSSTLSSSSSASTMTSSAAKTLTSSTTVSSTSTLSRPTTSTSSSLRSSTTSSLMTTSTRSASASASTKSGSATAKPQ